MQFRPAAVLILALSSVPDATASDAVDQVAKLYESAFYDQALTLAARVTTDSATAASELQQLRTLTLLCELALGRDVEAGRTAEEIARVQPLPSPGEADLPPPVRNMLADVRGRLVPDLARERYQRGRERMEQKNYADALADFEFVISLIDNGAAPAASQPALADMRLLAIGFRDLTASKVPAPAVETAAPSAPVAAVRTTPVTRATQVTQPEPLRQQVPAFVSARGTPLGAESPSQKGVLEFTIGKDGSVTAARMTTPINPLYDAMVIRAARQWKYRPGLADGVPIEVVKTMTIKVGSDK